MADRGVATAKNVFYGRRLSLRGGHRFRGQIQTASNTMYRGGSKNLP